MESLYLLCLLVFLVRDTRNNLRNKNNYYNSNDNWDWRDFHPISSVDNELITNCSSSYVFAAVGAIEGLEINYSKNSKKISSQEYLDCSGVGSCELGSVTKVINYYSNRKVCKCESYEYSGKINECRKEKCESVSTIKKIFCSVSKKENEIKDFIYIAPVPTKIYIDSLRDYKGGVYKDYDACDHKPNHWVLVVGYGVEGNDKYWIIKNDFGEEWGEKGYLRLERGKGMCGIGKESYVLYYEEWKTWVTVVIITFGVVLFLGIIACCCCCCYFCRKDKNSPPPSFYENSNTSADYQNVD